MMIDRRMDYKEEEKFEDRGSLVDLNNLIQKMFSLMIQTKNKTYHLVQQI